MSSGVAQYIAGFIDGDGCIRLHAPSETCPRPTPYVAITQSYNRREPPELRDLQRRLGGTIQVQGDATETQRKKWVLHIAVQHDVQKVLELISRHGVVKKAQADVALQYLQQGRPSDGTFSEEVTAAKALYHTAVIDETKLTDAYCAGLFAAEGYLGTNPSRAGGLGHTFRSCIAQAQCEHLLYAIRAKLGYGNVARGVLSFASGQTLRFIERVESHMQKSQKRRQVRYVLEKAGSSFLKPQRGKKRTPEDREKMEKIVQRLKKMKRR